MRPVLIVVFDGLQPSQVTSELTPNLTELAADGVIFDRHHAGFPTVTRTNVASMVTGRNPGGHGIAGNTLVFRDFDPGHALPAMEPQLARIAKKTGHVLLAPTLADILSRHNKEYIAVGVGTSGNTYLHNPNAERSGGATVHPSFCLPSGLHDKILGRFGRWPEHGLPNSRRMAHAVDITTNYLLPERSPLVSLIWFSEPDGAQHAEGVNSKLAKKAINAADEQLGRLLSWLEDNGLSAETDLIVVSDHGYSTITGVVDIEAQVREAGFPCGDRPGGVVIAPNGGSVLFYVYDSDRKVSERLAEWLMTQPWCGPLITSEAATGIRGTLPAALVGNEGVRAPEITMSFKWEHRANQAGFPGHVYSSSGTPGVGQHGSMSAHEIRNVLIARGPSFKRGISLDTPSGNLDLAPTILEILGIRGGDDMDGRVLREALVNGPDPQEADWSKEIHRSERRINGGTYRQQVTLSRVGTTTYLEEGCGGFEAG